MSSQQDNSQYSSPELTEYGPVESITEDQNKIGTGTDEYSQNTPLVGSVVDA